MDFGGLSPLIRYYKLGKVVDNKFNETIPVFILFICRSGSQRKERKNMMIHLVGLPVWWTLEFNFLVYPTLADSISDVFQSQNDLPKTWPSMCAPSQIVPTELGYLAKSSCISVIT